MDIGEYVNYYEELAIVDDPLIYTCPVLYLLDRQDQDKEKRFRYVTEVDVEPTYECHGINILDYIVHTNTSRRGYYMYVFYPEADRWMEE